MGCLYDFNCDRDSSGNVLTPVGMPDRVLGYAYVFCWVGFGRHVWFYCFGMFRVLAVEGDGLLTWGFGRFGWGV